MNPRRSKPGRSRPPPRTTARSVNGRSSIGCSAWASWTHSACGSTTCRWVGPSGRFITAGVSPDTKAEGTAAGDAVAVTFSFETLTPKRLTGVYEYTHEEAASVPAIERALRRDLAAAVKAEMSDLIINADEATNSHEPDGLATTPSAQSFVLCLVES